VETWTIVVAAGSGARFGGAKQFQTVGDDRLVDIAVRTATRSTDHVVLVLPAGAVWDGPPVAAAVAGGATRADSVRAGVDVVVVHDATRPLATGALFAAVIDAVRDGADGAVPGLPIADTIKRVEGEQVIETVPRDDLVAVQTPQAFRAGALRAAHRECADATDDATLVERDGGKVVVVPGDPVNIKVTGPADLDLVTALQSLRSRP
jgi:2-C-methyl-D-erythritol 4-phosphate cytidylyltransferase